MVHQRFVAALASALAAACLAPAAGAQPPGTRIPKEAVVVAGPTPSGARLVAFDRGRTLCLAFLERPADRGWVYPNCERPGGSVRAVGLTSEGSPGIKRYWGVVHPDVAAVDLVFHGGRSVRAPTSEGAAYQGRYAGEVRFLLVEEQRRERVFRSPLYLRLYDAAGALLGLGHAFGVETRVGRLRELARGSTAGVGWSLMALSMRTLAGLPGNEERFANLSCIEVRRRGPLRVRGLSYPRRSRARMCVNPEARGSRSEFNLDPDCAPLGLAGTGLVASDVRAVVAVLGDGSTRRLRLRRLPAAYGGRRAFAFALGRAVAVRRLVEITFGGQRRVLEREIGPGAARCGDDGAVVFAFGSEPDDPRGPLALTVYDEGVQLCATLGRPSRDSYECRYPPIAAEDAWILARTEGARKLLAGIVPADVAAAVVELDDGRHVTVDTQADGVYGGRYATSLRFFTLELEAGTRITTIRLVDTSGRRTLARWYYEEPAPVARPHIVVGGPPGLRLRAQRHGDPGGPFPPYLCVSLGGGRCSPGYAGGAAVTASCKPRRLVFWGLLPRGRSAVTLETDAGSVRARVRTLPRVLRPALPARPRWQRAIQPVAAFVVAAPRDTRPTALVISGRRESRRMLRLPPASEQCGYDDFLF